MKPMPLMDKVHAWTFANKVGEYKVNQTARAVQLALRNKLKKAERFTLDDASVRLVSLFLKEETLENWSCLARLSHDVVWVEINAAAKFKDPGKSSKIGILLFRDATDRECHRWVSHCFADHSEHGVYAD